MAINQQITSAPPAPQRSDPNTFANKADVFVSWLEKLDDELNQWASEANSTASQVNQDANTAQTSAEQAQTFRDEAASAAIATVYDDNATYNYPDTVIGSDGHVYRCLGTNVTGDDPVTSSSGNWAKLTISYSDVEEVSNKIGTPAVTKPTITGITKVKANTTFNLYGNKNELYTAYKDNGAELDYLEWTLPNNSTVTGDSISYTAPAEHGYITFYCRAYDTLGNKSELASFTVEVGDNSQPWINSVTWDSNLFRASGSYIMTIDATDLDGDPLTYEVTADDSNVTITQDEIDDYKFHITFPDYDNDTEVTFTITVTDPSGDSATAQTTVTVVAKIVDFLGVIRESYNDYFHCICADSEGNTYIGGYGGSINGSNNDAVLVKINPDKTLNKAIAYHIGLDTSTASRIFYDIKYKDNYLWLCGYGVGEANNYQNHIVLKINPSDLTNIISSYSQTSGTKNHQLYSLDFDSSGNVYVCGYYMNTKTHAFIAKFDSNLSKLADKSYGNDSNHDYFYGIFVDNSDNIYCVGYTYEEHPAGQGSALLYKFDTDLNVVTRKAVGVSGGLTSFYNVKTDDNYIYTCGYMYNSEYNGACPVIMKFSKSDFSLVDVFQFKWGGNGFRDLIITDNEIYCVGFTNSGDIGNRDIIIVKIDKNTFTATNAIYIGNASNDYCGNYNPVILDNSVLKVVGYGLPSDIYDDGIVLDVYNILDGTYAGTNTDYQCVDCRYKTITGESVGTGDGTTTVFNLRYSQVTPNSETIYLDGTPTSSYTIDYDTGEITFTSAPAQDVAITADYEFDRFHYPNEADITVADSTLTEIANVSSGVIPTITTVDVTSSYSIITDELA